jgi:hypothetical protein
MLTRLRQCSFSQNHQIDVTMRLFPLPRHRAVIKATYTFVLRIANADRMELLTPTVFAINPLISEKTGLCELAWYKT